MDFFCIFESRMSLLFINSISGGEIIIVLLIVLMFFGSESIPKIARTMGRTVRKFKDTTQDIQREISDTAKDSVKEIKGFENEIKDSIENKK